MLVINLLLGTLASALVVQVDRADAKRMRKEDNRADEIRRAAAALRSPDIETQRLIDEAFRRHSPQNPTIEHLAATIGGDPLWGERLVRWVLEPDPVRRETTREELGMELAAACSNASQDEVTAFLQGLYDGVHAHPEVSRLRSDHKLDQVLLRLDELEDLPALLTEHQLYIRAQLAEILSRERRQHIKPVCPDPRPWTMDNGLLHGNRPRDKDMDEELDFRRTKFDEVMQAVRDVDRYPVAFVFHAFPQQGKTTFLKRVGWELAKEGYAVVQLEVASLQEPYAHWLLVAAEELNGRTLVALIDDPHTGGEHFENQMMTLSERGPRILCLIASRASDWENIDTKRAQLLADAAYFELEPDGLEGVDILDHLIDRQVVQLEESRLPEVRKRVQRLPTGIGYFHKIIQLASDDRFKETSVLVEEKLTGAAGSPEAVAFEKFYGFVCLFGMVGLPLGRAAAADLANEDTRYLARKFSEGLANEPILWQEDRLEPTHELHAEGFFQARDWKDWLGELLQRSSDRISLRDPAGFLLEALRSRGHGDQCRQVWATHAQDLPDGYWENCSPISLDVGWSTFLFKLGFFPEALEALGHALVAYENLGRSSQQATASVDKRIGQVLIHQGLVHRHQKAWSLAALSYGEVVSRFGSREEIALQEKVARALVHQGVAYCEQEAWPLAASSYNEVVSRFGSREEIALEEWVARALMNQGVAYGEQEAWSLAASSYGEVVSRFGSREELALQEWVATALFKQGSAYGKQEAWSLAAASNGEVVSRFGSREEPIFRELVAGALNYTFLVHVHQASSVEPGSRAQRDAWAAAEAALRDYASRTGKPLSQDYNYACLLALRGETEKALKGLEACLEHGAISLDHVKKDSDWDNLRDHPDYKSLIARYSD